MCWGVQSVVDHHKGHPLPYDINCAIALAKECADKSKDILAWGVEEPAVPTQLGPSALDEPPALDNAAQVPAEHHTKPQDRMTQQKTASLVTTMTAITTGAPTECSLAVLCTSLGQQDKQSARDRCQIDELSQQLSDTTTQLTHISKVLDHLLTSHTPMAKLVDIPAVLSTSAVNSTAPPGQASSLLQQSTASGEINSSASSFHINMQAAPHSHTGDLQDQAGPAQAQAHNSTLNHSARPFFPLDFLIQFPASLGTPMQGQHPAINQQQHPQATSTMGLSGATQYSTLDGTLYSNSRPGLDTLLASGPLPCSSQTITNATSIAMDIATMAKVIPNMPLKLQQRIIQGEFIDLSELLQADFQFKYASIDSNNAFELVHKDETLLMWPRKKGRQINCLSMWLSAWASYKQVMVYTYPQWYSKLASYRNFIMQQDKKFIWSVVQMYDIRFHVMHTHHSCPFTTTDQVLMATILAATAVMTSSHKCI